MVLEGNFLIFFESLFHLDLDVKMPISCCDLQCLVDLGLPRRAPGCYPKAVLFGVPLLDTFGRFWDNFGVPIGAPRSIKKSKSGSQKMFVANLLAILGASPRTLFFMVFRF